VTRFCDSGGSESFDGSILCFSCISTASESQSVILFFGGVPMVLLQKSFVDVMTGGESRANHDSTYLNEFVLIRAVSEMVGIIISASVFVVPFFCHLRKVEKGGLKYDIERSNPPPATVQRSPQLLSLRESLKGLVFKILQPGRRNWPVNSARRNAGRSRRTVASF
jgi:hypothetical protein